jgi:predicted nucleic-acid-binding protein
VIAVDTNVVVRLLANDDPPQVKRAAALFARERVFVAKSVLLETEWVLRFTYGLSTAAIARSFRALTGLATVTVEDDGGVTQALDWFEAGLDFADALHLSSSCSEADGFATFDRQLLRDGARVTRRKVTSP